MNRGSRAARILRATAIDLRPLRSSQEYRRIWFGQMVSGAGRQITVVALFVQITDLTGSPAAVGLLGLVQLVPMVLVALLAGSILDAVDRRKLLIVTQSGLIASTAILLWSAVAEAPPVWVPYLASAMSAAFFGLEAPTRSALTPRLVSKAQLPAALALNVLAFNTALVVGPALGGIILGAVGLVWAYTIDLLTFVASLIPVLTMTAKPPLLEPGQKPSTGLPAIKEGLAFLKGRRLILWTFGIDLIAMIFGMPRALFPILAVEQFAAGATVTGALFAAPGAGALVASVTSGWVSRVRRQGLAVVIAVGIWGLGIAGFGLVRSLPAALFLLAVAGGADVISAVFRGTILQTDLPDALRGRVSAVHILVVTGGPRLGDFEAGAVAEIFSPTVSVVSGGIACVVGAAAVAARVPELVRYRSEEPPERA